MIVAKSPSYQLKSPLLRANFVFDDNFIAKLKKIQRTSDDIKMIYEYIQDLIFVKKLQEKLGTAKKDQALLYLAKFFTYEKYPRNEFIFKEKESLCDKYFVILKGSVYIICKSPHESKVSLLGLKSTADNIEIESGAAKNGPRRKGYLIESKTSFSLPPPEKKETRGSVISTLFANKFIKNLKLNKPSNEESDSVKSLIASAGVIKRHIKASDSFGEDALINFDNDNPLRYTSAFAVTDVEVLTFSRTHFLETLNRFDEKKSKKSNFLSSVLPYLKTVTSSVTLENLLMMFQEEIIPKDLIVTLEQEVDPYERIYFLYEGNCKINKKAKVNGSSKSSSEIHTFTISEIGPGGVIGEEILFNEDNMYEYTTIVTSDQAGFYYVSKSMMMLKFPKETIEYLRNNLFTKEKIRVKFIQNKLENGLKSREKNDLEKIQLEKARIGSEDFLKVMTKKIKLAFDNVSTSGSSKLAKENPQPQPSIYKALKKEGAQKIMESKRKKIEYDFLLKHNIKKTNKKIIPVSSQEYNDNERSIPIRNKLDKEDGKLEKFFDEKQLELNKVHDLSEKWDFGDNNDKEDKKTKELIKLGFITKKNEYQRQYIRDVLQIKDNYMESAKKFENKKKIEPYYYQKSLPFNKTNNWSEGANEQFDKMYFGSNKLIKGNASKLFQSFINNSSQYSKPLDENSFKDGRLLQDSNTNTSDFENDYNFYRYLKIRKDCHTALASSRKKMVTSESANTLTKSGFESRVTSPKFLMTSPPSRKNIQSEQGYRNTINFAKE